MLPFGLLYALVVTWRFRCRWMVGHGLPNRVVADEIFGLPSHGLYDGRTNLLCAQRGVVLLFKISSVNGAFSRCALQSNWSLRLVETM